MPGQEVRCQDRAPWLGASVSQGYDMSPSARVQELLEKLAGAAPETDVSPANQSLDAHTRALVTIGAAVCMDSPTSKFESLVSQARLVGVTDEEILGALFAVAAAAGESRLVTVSPRVSRALGYDIDEAFEKG